jgi:hypothetical protein
MWREVMSVTDSTNCTNKEIKNVPMHNICVEMINVGYHNVPSILIFLKAFDFYIFNK